MAVYIQDIFTTLDVWGVREVLLPFLLIFTLVFAVLQKSNILGKDNRQFNAAIALIISLSVVIPHVSGAYPMGFDVIEIINAVIPQISLIMVALVMMLILLGVFAPAASSLVFIVSLVLVFFMFLGTTEYLYGLSWFYNIFGEEAVSTAFAYLIIGIIVYMIITPPGKEGAMSELTKFVEKIFQRP